ncbi:MAG TPA: aquaporin [Pedococcus sp.]|jgi:aquaporin Z|nr:aquaporin [Pedococcus sp.]
MTRPEDRAPAAAPAPGSLDALRARHGTHIAELLEREPAWARDFTDLSQEWRRLFAETFGTFLLVLVAAGGAVLDAKTHSIGRAASVTAPGLLVMALILSIGAVSGAHLNPVVSIAFALRRDFQWRRVPGYVAAQALGAVLACLLLRSLFGTVGALGATLPKPGFSTTQAFLIETVLTLGLVTVILGTASSAQNVGPLAALAVGGYIVLAGLWASPVSGASMNPTRSLGPDLVRGNLHALWPYLAGPLVGALIAVAAAHILRGPGGDPAATTAAQGRPLPRQ